MPTYLIIGGSDAGISAALRIKELENGAQVLLFLKDDYPNYSICGIPFFLSGEITDWHALAHRTLATIAAAGITVHASEPVLAVDAAAKTVTTALATYAYDKLLLATGATSVLPPIAGTALPGVFALRWIGDMLALDYYLKAHPVRRALIVGGGYIGVEMADALIQRGLTVTLAEPSPAVLKTLDPELGQQVGAELARHRVTVRPQFRVQHIRQQGPALVVTSEAGATEEAELVLLATGAKPNTDLLRNQGIGIGAHGAYTLNQRMESTLPDVYVAGDCAETWHALLQRYQYLPLGTTAHKQGRVAGENMVGGAARFAGSLGTQVVKVFDLVAGRTGLHERDCREHQVPSRTVESTHFDHKQYYPGAQPLTIRLTGNPATGELLGMQILGPYAAEVAKRLDIAAVALRQRLTVEQLNELDLSYTPPLSSPWDPVQMAAQAWLRAG